MFVCVQFLQDTGDFQQAEEVLNKAVLVEPDNPLGYFSLGLVPSSPESLVMIQQFPVLRRVQGMVC